MDDSVTVKIFEGAADLVDVTLCLQLVESLSSSQELIQRLIRTELEQDVDVLGIFKEVLEPDDIIVMERSVDFDFRHELLLGP